MNIINLHQINKLKGFTLISLLRLRRRSCKGFTLIELMIAISIIAIMATVGFSAYSQSQVRARDAKRKQDLRAIAQALELFYQRNQRFPCSGATAGTWQASNAAAWLTDSNSCAGGTNTRIDPLYINRLPKDPLSDDGLPTGSTGFGYAYWSPNAASGTCAIGQYYVLITKLENINDTERLGTQTLTYCGNVQLNTTSTGGSLNANNFLLISQ